MLKAQNLWLYVYIYIMFSSLNLIRLIYGYLGINVQFN